MHLWFQQYFQTDSEQENKEKWSPSLVINFGLALSDGVYKIRVLLPKSFLGGSDTSGLKFLGHHEAKTYFSCLSGQNTSSMFFSFS